MSKLSDISLVILVIGTSVVISSFFLLVFLIPIVFTYTLISGLILIFISLIIGLITRNEYHVIKLKSGFPLKLDHLIILICALSISLYIIVFLDILHLRFTGKFPYYTLSGCVLLIGIGSILYFLRK